MTEKTPRLRPHERPPVNHFIAHYAGRLGAGSMVGQMPGGKVIRLADPVEHGYVTDATDIPPNIELGQE